MLITEAHAQAAETTQAAAQALGKLSEQGILGLFCVLLICALIWAMWRKGEADKGLVEAHKARVEEAKVLTETVVTISRNMAAVSTALEANNRTSVEGNLFRQNLAQAMEGMEKAFETESRTTNDHLATLRTTLESLRSSTDRLSEEVRRSLPRGAP